MPDAHVDEPALSSARKEAAVGGDGPRDSAEQALMMLDSRHQQPRIGSGFVDRNVSDNSALSFLDLHHRSELRWTIKFPLADDLRPRLEDTDDLAWRAGLGPKHAGPGLPQYLTTMLRGDADVVGDPVDATS